MTLDSVNYSIPMKLFLRAWDVVAQREDGSYPEWARKTPNFLCWLRLILSAPAFGLLSVTMSLGLHKVAIAAWCFIVGLVLTDVVDGELARHMGAESDKGKILDPLADKVLTASGLAGALAITAGHAVLGVTIALIFVAGLIVASELGGAETAQAEKKISDHLPNSDLAPRAEIWGKVKFNFYAVGMMLLFAGPLWSLHLGAVSATSVAIGMLGVGYAFFGRASNASHVRRYGVLCIAEAKLLELAKVPSD
jgi:phosphatidylglycerophosphate synthase